MAKAYSGLGLAPLGTSVLGYGTPATSDSTTRAPYLIEKGDTTQTQGDAALINPATRDFVVDPLTGQYKGMTGVQQEVYLALITVRGSSADGGMGQTFSTIQTLSPDTETAVKSKVREALARLVGRGAISIVSIAVRVVTTQLFISVEWLDRTSGAAQTTSV